MKNILLALCISFVFFGCEFDPNEYIEKQITQYKHSDTLYETPDGKITLILNYDTAKSGDHIYDIHSGAIEDFISAAELKYDKPREILLNSIIK